MDILTGVVLASEVMFHHDAMLPHKSVSNPYLKVAVRSDRESVCCGNSVLRKSFIDDHEKSGFAIRAQSTALHCAPTSLALAAIPVLMLRLSRMPIYANLVDFFTHFPCAAAPVAAVCGLRTTSSRTSIHEYSGSPSSSPQASSRPVASQCASVLGGTWNSGGRSRL